MNEIDKQELTILCKKAKNISLILGIFAILIFLIKTCKVENQEKEKLIFTITKK
jgi:hypothetical protein